MSIEERLIADMKIAMKAGNKQDLETIRMLRAQIKDARISKREDLSEEEVEEVLYKAAKSRKEAIRLYKEGNREDLVAKEQAEINLIFQYLPEQLSEDELSRIIDSMIISLNISSEKDIGRLMGQIMPKVKGKADGKLVQQLVRNALAKLGQ